MGVSSWGCLGFLTAWWLEFKSKGSERSGLYSSSENTILEVPEGCFHNILLTKQVLKPGQEEGILPDDEKCKGIRAAVWSPRMNGVSEGSLISYPLSIYSELTFPFPNEHCMHKKSNYCPSLTFYFLHLCVSVDAVFSTQNAHLFPYYSFSTLLYLF